MERVWPGQYVEEGNLTRNVSTLRRALGENPDEHRYIVTIPGHGYRFVAEVKEVTNEDVVATADSAAAAASPFTSRRRSIALALAALLVLLTGVGGLVGWYFRPKSPPPVWRAVPLTSYRAPNATRRFRRTATRWLSHGTERGRTISTSTSS